MANDTTEAVLQQRIKELEKNAARYKKAKDYLQRYAFIINTSKDWNSLINVNYEYEAVNQALCQSLSKNKEDVLGTTVAQIWGDKKFETIIKPKLDACFRGEEIKDHDWIDIPSVGSQCFNINYYPYFASNGKVTHAVVVSRNITERKKAQLELESYLHIVSASRDLVALFDRDYAIMAASQGYIDFFGKTREQIIGQRISDLIGEDVFVNSYKPLIDKCLTGNDVRHQSWVESPDGQKRFLDIAYYPHYAKNQNRVTGFVISARDLTANKRLEERLRQSYKMEAIGTLAGGIAHDFNNILSAIIGYSELSLTMIDNDDLKQNIVRIQEAGQRASELVKQILAFSRQTDQELKPIQIAVVLKEVLKLLRASLPSTITIKQNIDSESYIMGDPTQVHQILLNLCTNAGHAMRPGGGILSLGLEDFQINAADVQTNPDFKVGTYIKLSVSDTGSGMEASIIDRIFDPFFTTKPKGEGTGMGLALVHGIVKSYSGVITVQSKPDAGTTVSIFIPIITSSKQKLKQDTAPLPTGNERILFVDDEEPLVEIAQSMLNRLGYTVTTQTNSVEALRLFERDPSRFDLIITDLTMPTIPGDKLASQVKALRPDIPIIMATGFSEQIMGKDLLSQGIAKIVLKPLLMSDIALAIREVLDDDSID